MQNVIHLPFNPKLDEPFPFPETGHMNTIDVEWLVSCGLDCFEMVYSDIPTIKQFLLDLIEHCYENKIDRHFALKYARVHATHSINYYRLSPAAYAWCMQICAQRQQSCVHEQFEEQRFGYSCTHCRAFYDKNKYMLEDGRIVIRPKEEEKKVG